MMQPKCQRLFRHVGKRQRIESIAGMMHLLVLAAGILYAALLLCSRLLALIPAVFDPITCLAVPLAALLLALIFQRRPSVVDTARLIDARAGTKDLFLTTALIDASPGEFKPIVLGQAEGQAASIKPREVIACRWGNRLRNMALAMVLLLAGVIFLPQLDPFGKEQARKTEARRRKELEETRKATALRKAMIEQKTTDLAASQEIDKAIEDLKKTFAMMKPEQKQENLQRLIEKQKELGDLWRKANEEKLKNSAGQTGIAQQFGGGNMQKLADWKQQLNKGDASGIKQELDEIRKMTRKLEEASPQDKERQRQEIKKKVEDLKDFVASEMNSRPADTALERALEQLGMSGQKELSKESLEALEESLDLAGLEMEDLAQNLEGMQSLEEALKAIQAARGLNGAGKLDGGASRGCKGISDYAEFYARLMRECNGQGEGEGDGPGGNGGGMGGPGIGRGGKAPEDETAKSGFKSEQSQSALTAGKILLEIKTRGVSDPGSATRDYAASVKEVKQGVSEAILQEQVPPGYHEAIRKYFDSVEDGVRPTSAKEKP